MYSLGGGVGAGEGWARREKGEGERWVGRAERVLGAGGGQRKEHEI